MVFDPLGVDCGGFRRDAQRDQKLINHLVPFLGSRRQRASLASQSDRLIRFGFDQSERNQSTQRAADGHMADRKPGGQVDDAAGRFFRDDLRDRLDVILRRLAGMVAASPAVRDGNARLGSGGSQNVDIQS